MFVGSWTKAVPVYMSCFGETINSFPFHFQESVPDLTFGCPCLWLTSWCFLLSFIEGCLCFSYNLWELFMYSGNESFIGYVDCMYLSLLCGLLFHPVVSFDKQKFLILTQFELLGIVALWPVFAYWWSQRYSPVFFSFYIEVLYSLVYDWGKSQDNFFPHGPPIYVYLLKHCLLPTSLQCHHCYISSIHVYVWDSLSCPCSVFVILSPISRWFK